MIARLQLHGVGPRTGVALECSSSERERKTLVEPNILFGIRCCFWYTEARQSSFSPLHNVNADPEIGRRGQEHKLCRHLNASAVSSRSLRLALCMWTISTVFRHIRGIGIHCILACIWSFDDMAFDSSVARRWCSPKKPTPFAVSWLQNIDNKPCLHWSLILICTHRFATHRIVIYPCTVGSA